MGVETWVWIASLVVLVGILVVDLLVIGRRPHEPSFRESTIWVSIYVGLAVLFGLGIWYFAGMDYAGQFYTGWLTEYSLSVDNLFIFVIIMARFAVPRHLQQKVLLIGIVLALVMRGAFIAAGAALISQFVWVFYIFGLFLLYTAVKLVSNGTISDDDYRENVLVRASRRILPISRDYDAKAHFFTTTPQGKRVFTPLIVVMIAIGTTDLVFALDSIPAIFGLTKEPYIVFATNVFALMGLRQLYFLLGGLLDRLKYLSYGLAIVLAFIGVKLVLEALHENNVPFINNGEPLTWIPTIPIAWSLAFIVATLAVTTVFSLVSSNREQAAAASDDKQMRARVKADQRIERS
jgi:tellurite resistance protein TerC